MSSFSVQFNNIWLLFLIIPALLLSILPLFIFSKRFKRFTIARIISTVLHINIAVLLVFSMVGMTFTSQIITVRSQVIIVVDLSDSTLPVQERQINDFIQATILESDNNHDIGIVTFGANQVLAAPLGGGNAGVFNTFRNAQRPIGNASNIAAALNFAANQFSNRADGRIILISDGFETDGDALSVARALESSGVRIDTVFFPVPPSSREVRVVSAIAPAAAAITIGQPINIFVELESASSGPAELRLYTTQTPTAGGQYISTFNAAKEFYSSQLIMLTEGISGAVIQYTPRTASFHGLKVEIRRDGDVISENNVMFTYIDLTTPSRILIIEGSSGEASYLAPILSSEFDVTVEHISEVETTLAAFLRFDKIILQNVSTQDFPQHFEMLLDFYVSEFGGGLLTSGGDVFYSHNNLIGTQILDMLPVVPSLDPPPMGVLFLVDTSSSMHRYGRQRIELAAAGITATANYHLRDKDYMGIICFNGWVNAQSTGVTRIIDMTPVSRRDEIIASTANLNRGAGTNFTAALLEAEIVLGAFDGATDLHIVFITDGDVHQAVAYVNAVVQRLANAGITLSVITIGEGNNDPILLDMAAIGGGTFTYIPEPSMPTITPAQVANISNIIYNDTRPQGTIFYNDFTFTPHVNRVDAHMQGVTQLPDLHGHFGMGLTSDATLILSSGLTGNPIYALRQHGEGRVGSFMADMSGTAFSRDFLLSNDGARFVLNVVRELFPSEPLRPEEIFDIAVVQHNMSVRLNFSSIISAGDILTITKTTPIGTSEVLPFNIVGNTMYATFETPDPGLYRLEIQMVNHAGLLVVSQTRFVVFSYSLEYIAFMDELALFAFMSNIAYVGGGNMLFPSMPVFGFTQEGTETTFNPLIIFLILAAVIFVVDVVIRNIGLKWPWEIIKERREKRLQVA